MVKHGEPDGSWHKSSYSSGGTCLEVSRRLDKVLVRDSHDPGSTVLTFDSAAFDELIAAVKHGAFDLG